MGGHPAKTKRRRRWQRRRNARTRRSAARKERTEDARERSDRRATERSAGRGGRDDRRQRTEGSGRGERAACEARAAGEDPRGPATAPRTATALATARPVRGAHSFDRRSRKRHLISTGRDGAVVCSRTWWPPLLAPAERRPDGWKMLYFEASILNQPRSCATPSCGSSCKRWICPSLITSTALTTGCVTVLGMITSESFSVSRLKV